MRKSIKRLFPTSFMFYIKINVTAGIRALVTETKPNRLGLMRQVQRNNITQSRKEFYGQCVTAGQNTEC